VQFLVEIDKLVQLLESPIFTSLRMQLLEPERYPFLFKSLYGLLMLLPQGSAFETLRTRLNSITTLGILQLIPKVYETLSLSLSLSLSLYQSAALMHEGHV